MIGSVIHSIEDFGAHSYVMDLQKYKSLIKNNREYQNVAKYQQQNEYHSDCNYVKGKYVRNKSMHREQKDTPYAIFEFKNGFYSWRRNSAGKIDEVQSRMDNPRYVGALYDTFYFLNSSIRKFERK